MGNFHRNFETELGLLAFSVMALASILAVGQEIEVPRKDKTLLTDVSVDTNKTGKTDKALLDKFQRLLTGAKMIGMFTVDGRPLDKLSAEEYEIQKAEKQDDGDLWLITARIKYGEKDYTVPVGVEVKWAGTTPVITLDKITIPGFGTFSARVLFHGDRYAGTWQHDAKGGHMFGKIELPKP